MGKQDENGPAPDHSVVTGVIGLQLQHFRNTVPPCRGMQLPDGILLRHNLSPSLFFYLRTKVEDGKIATQIFASDSPYEQKKAEIGHVRTPMLDPQADSLHLERLQEMIQEWVEFVGSGPDADRDFQSFVLQGREPG